MGRGLSDQDGRTLYELSFEPHGDGYVFYRHAWSRGVAVTAEEREASLQPPYWRSRLAFTRKIRGRPPAVPPRGWLLTQRKLWDALPVGLVLTMLGAALPVILHAQDHESSVLRWAQSGLGLVIALYGAALLITRSRG